MFDRNFRKKTPLCCAKLPQKKPYDYNKSKYLVCHFLHSRVRSSVRVTVVLLKPIPFKSYAEFGLHYPGAAG